MELLKIILVVPIFLLTFASTKTKNIIETIFTKIKTAVEEANIEHIVYKEGYPMDIVKLDEDFTGDESNDTLTPLVLAMKVIMGVIEKEGTPEDDIRVCFGNLPCVEDWFISIGDGR